jgi:hypothetical protein
MLNALNLQDARGWGLHHVNKALIFASQISKPAYYDPHLNNWLICCGGQVIRIDTDKAHPSVITGKEMFARLFGGNNQRLRNFGSSDRAFSPKCAAVQEQCFQVCVCLFV